MSDYVQNCRNVKKVRIVCGIRGDFIEFLIEMEGGLLYLNKN